jgi:putative membrane protein
MSAPEPRKPRVFDADDPAVVVEEPAALPPEAGAGGDGPQGETAAGEAAQTVRPTLADIGERGLRWGMLLVSALAGAAFLGLAAWFARLVSAALVREDWLGQATLVLLAVAAFAALMLALREAIGLVRMTRLNRIKAEVARAIADRDSKRERRAALRLAALYARRPEHAWSVRAFRDHARDVHDAGELIALADREMVAPVDKAARRLVTASAKRVATVTALSPMVLIAVGYVAVENLRLMRGLASLYGGRPGFVGLMRLARLVLGHLVATGGIALTDDLLGQFLGQDILRRLSRRLGEGAFNGALTARIGIAAIEVIRPLPFLAAKRPRVRDVLGEALKLMLSAGKG